MKEKDDRVKLMLLTLLIPVPGIVLLFLFSGVNQKSMESAKAVYSIFLVLWVIGSLAGVGSLLVDRAIKSGGGLLALVKVVNVICGLTIAFVGLQVFADGVRSLSATACLIALAAGGFMFFFWNRKKQLAASRDATGDSK